MPWLIPENCSNDLSTVQDTRYDMIIQETVDSSQKYNNSLSSYDAAFITIWSR